MRIRGVRAFRRDVTQLLRDDEPVLVLRRGKPAGVLYPTPDGVLPRDVQGLVAGRTDYRGRRASRSRVEQLRLSGIDAEATS